MRAISRVASTVLLVGVMACSGPVEPTAASDLGQTGSSITLLTPNSGSPGTQVVIHGFGFTETGNTVTFAARNLDPPGRMPAEPSVIPNLPSRDGKTIVFSVLSVWRPACSYSPPGPCPFANFPTAPGSYAVSVANANGVSNAMSFVVDR